MCWLISIETVDDSEGTLLYQWYLVSGPLQSATGGHDSWNKPLLTLEHLKIGKYVFK